MKQNTDLVNDALKYLQQAVNINPNYDAAMSFLNLTYRRKADLECGDDAARKADLAQADEWVQRAMGARKANEAAKEKAAAARWHHSAVRSAFHQSSLNILRSKPKASPTGGLVASAPRVYPSLCRPARASFTQC